jgi:hypothetical protein
MVPHVWAYIGDDPETLLVAIQPAGSFEAFFRELRAEQVANARGRGSDACRPRDEDRRSSSRR